MTIQARARVSCLVVAKQSDTVAMGNLSPELIGRVQLELARAVEQLPGQQGKPGGSRYELKWDGSLH